MMIPSEKEWVVIFSSNNKPLGIMQYTEDEDVLRFEVTPERAEFVEWLNYEFEKTSDLAATLSLSWDNLKVGFEIEAMDHRKTEASEHDDQ